VHLDDEPHSIAATLGLTEQEHMPPQLCAAADNEAEVLGFNLLGASHLGGPTPQLQEPTGPRHPEVSPGGEGPTGNVATGRDCHLWSLIVEPGGRVSLICTVFLDGPDDTAIVDELVDGMGGRADRVFIRVGGRP